MKGTQSKKMLTKQLANEDAVKQQYKNTINKNIIIRRIKRPTNRINMSI